MGRGARSKIARDKPESWSAFGAIAERRGPLASRDIAGIAAPAAAGGAGATTRRARISVLVRRDDDRAPPQLRAALRSDRTRLPAAILAAPTPGEAADAQRELLRIAARALASQRARICATILGWASPCARAGGRLVENGELVPSAVEGWKQTAYVASALRIPRTVEARALLSPFDSLIFERARTERLSDFATASKSTFRRTTRHGYYVLPYLHGDLSRLASTSSPIARAARCSCGPCITNPTPRAKPKRACAKNFARWPTGSNSSASSIRADAVTGRGACRPDPGAAF